MPCSKPFSSVKASFYPSQRSPQPHSNDMAIQKRQQLLPSALLPTSRRENTQKDDAETMALSMIELKPNDVDGYLLAGQFYEKRNRLSAARAIYANSLSKVPLTDPRYHELDLALKNLDTRRSSFVSLFPYDISETIFRYLTRDDLIECAGVCQVWNHFILQWPKFWELLDGVIERTAFDSLLGDKGDRFYMLGEANNALLSPMLGYLVATGASNIKSIQFEDMLLKEKDIDMAVNAVNSCTSAVEELTFKDVHLGDPAHVLLEVVGQCPQLKHFAYSVGIRGFDREQTFPISYPAKDPLLKRIPHDVYMLTTLDLSMGRSFTERVQLQPLSLLPRFLKRCPHLERLKVDSDDIVSHEKPKRASIKRSSRMKDLMSAVVKYCPRLKDLVSAHPAWSMPSIDEDLRCNMADSEKKGLQRFVFSYYMEDTLIWASDLVPLIKKHHKTLAVLYLRFDDDKLLDTRFLLLLARYGMPQLRELYLYTEGSRPEYTWTTIYRKETLLSQAIRTLRRRKKSSLTHYIIALRRKPSLSQVIINLGRKKPTLSQAIVALAKRCPELRILHVVEKRIYCWDPSLYEIDIRAIFSVILHCRFLKQFKIDTKRNHTAEIRG